MPLGIRPTYALQAPIVALLSLTLGACGIPWANLQNGSRPDADAARTDGTVFADATIDSFDGGGDVLAVLDATDNGSISDSVIDTPQADVTDVRPPLDVTDVTDATTARDVVDVPDVGAADSADVQSGCYGVGGTCSSTQPCCSGIMCTSGTCTSSCVTLSAPCPSGGCCAGMSCMGGFCRPVSCQDLHGSCSVSSCCVGLTCVSGTCECPTGMTTCTIVGINFCADLQSNARNCGSCGHRCSSGLSCIGGVCR